MRATDTAALAKLVEDVQDDRDVLAVMLFGSEARNDATASSDVDLCLVLDEGLKSGLDQSEKRLAYLASFSFDIQIFQQLPLFLRERVLKEGKILFCRDETRLYEIAFETARHFEDFRHIHEQYLEAVAGG